MTHLSAQIAMMAWVGWKDALPAAGFPLSQAAGTVLITAIWQGTVVAACLALSLRVSRRVSAGLRFTLWAAGFVAVLGLPFLPLLLHAGAGSGFAAGAAGARTWLQLDSRWSVAIALLWIAASLYRAADLLLHSVRLRRLWKTAQPVQLPSMEESATVPARLWGRRPIEICTSRELDRPSVIGFFAPRILIPEWLFAQITAGELEQIVLHETEHLRRGDDWTNLLQKLSLVLFPLNPALLWMERRLCLEREMACDDAVIRVTQAPKAYAACLTSLAERGLERRAEALSLGAWQRRPEVVHRVHSILLRRKALGPFGTRTAATMMAGGLVMGTVELARCPQLVTFTSQPHEMAAKAVLPDTRNSGTAGDAVFHEGLSAMPVSTTAAGRPRMVELRATMPVRSGVSLTPPPDGRAAKAKPWSGTANVAARQPSPILPVRSMDDSQDKRALRADLGGAPTTGREPTPEQIPATDRESNWIVLTTWEEAGPVEQSPSTSDSAAAAGVRADGAKAAVPADVSGEMQGQMPGRLTVTQLVLRVPQGSSITHSQAIVPFRNGWLVIQL